MEIKQFYSAKELADLKIEGLPVSKKGMIDLANRDSWINRVRSGKGGGLEYQPPKKVMDLVKLKAVESAVSTVKTEVDTVKTETNLTLKSDTTQLKDWQRQTAEARAVIVQEVKRPCRNRWQR